MISTAEILASSELRAEPELWSLVGNTPLLPIRRPDATVLLKTEWLNPGGSVKDRAAREILRAGLRTGALPHRRLLDASSGNTAVAYAMLGAAAGIGITVCVPANASVERLALLRAYSAEVVATDPLEGSDGAIATAESMAAADPALYWYANQYANAANALAHERTTGPEIWRDTEGRITHFVAGLGTTGTLTGTSRFLKAHNPTVRIIGVQPAGPLHGLEGLKHLATARVPEIFDPALIDDMVFVDTEEADQTVRRLAATQGLFVGWSAGAALVAASRVLQAMDSDERDRATMVVVAPDGGTRFLSETERLPQG